MANNTRPLYVIAAYISTRLKAEKYHEFLEIINATILKIKTETSEPHIILAGDFNRRDISEVIGDYVDVEVVTTAATRGGRR